MSTWRQSCPHCGRVLELPADAKGRLGQCPACDATFTIGEETEAAQDSPVDAANQMAEAAKPRTGPTAEPDQSDQSVFADRPALDQPSASADNFPSARPLDITSCSIEDVLSVTLAIFSARWATCLVPSVILAVATLLFVVPSLVTLDLLTQAGATALAGVGYVLFLPTLFLLSAYTTVGVARVALAIARNDETPLRQFVSPPVIVGRAIGIGLLFSLTVGFACIVMFAFIAVINASGAKELARLLSVLAGLASVALAFGVAWHFWAALFVCADEKGTVVGSFRAAQAISSENKLTSFFVALIALVLSILGTLMCFVGHIVTVPITMLLFSVAYLMMTGQGVSDPRDPLAEHPSQAF